MCRVRASRRSVLWAMGLGALCVLGSPPLWALQRAVKAKAHNYPHTPMVVKQVKATLTEVFGTPTQANAEDTRTRIRYANRANQIPSTYILQGEAVCLNGSSQSIEAFKLNIIALDAFHQPIHLPNRREPYAVQQIVKFVPEGSSKSIEWEQVVESEDVYEVVVVVTGVRFSDGSVWHAPDEELLDTF